MRVDEILVSSCVLAALAACGNGADSSPTARDLGAAPVGTTAPQPAAGIAGTGTQGTTAQPGPASTAGQGGHSATVPPPAQAGAGPADEPAMPGDDPADDPTDDDPGLVLDQCGLDTGFPGDEYCILPPPADQGFQVHIGPGDYDNPGSYLMQPGDESTEDFPAVAGNDGDVFFYYRQYRMRPGSHHLIISQASGGLGDGGRRLGGSQNVAKDNPDRGVTAPENEGIGMPLAARAPLNVQLHYINTSSAPVLREAWINFWYKDPATVTEQAKEMFANGGLGMNIPAGQRTVLGPYSCAVAQAGRVLTLYGHRHANAPRFSAWRVRSGQRELIYESLNWAEPMVLEFNTITENPAPDRAKGIEGGHSGILDLMPGDALEWECEVDNTHDFALRFGNQTYDSEMCILIGDTVGPTVACQYL
jgi:hypothetical protein